MSPTTAATVPPATQAQILITVAKSRYPRMILGDVAHSYHLAMDQLKTILDRNGYPDPDAMMRRAVELTAEGLAQADPSSDPTGAAAGDTTGDVESVLGRLVQVKVTDLHPDPNNVRDTPGDVTELADSMLEVGLLQPIVARRHDNRLYVVAGHRRLAAALHLRWDTVPCIIRAPMRPDDVLAAMLIENGQRADLDPIEEARGLNRLKVTGNLSDAALARKIGRSQGHVSTRLALLALTAEEQDQVRAGEMKLVEATQRGRLNSGKIGKRGVPRGWHLGPTHDLANRAKARCIAKDHPRGRTVGGMACGECWEAVIRADERQQLHNASARTGDCALCSQPITTSTHTHEVGA